MAVVFDPDIHFDHERTMKKYKIAVQHSLEGTEKLVADLLNRGWILQGGISVIELSPGKFQYFQAMVKDENE